MTIPSLAAALSGVRRVALDTSVLIAARQPGERHADCAGWLMDQIERGAFAAAVISSVTVAEVLVRPIASSVDAGLLVQGLIRRYPHLTVAPLDLEVAVEVAHVRAATRLPMPDAIVIGTAMAHRVDALVHTDREWMRKAGRHAAAVKLVYLGDHCP